MYDYWEDIENIELYSELPEYKNGVHLAITDHSYFVDTKHEGEQVKVYSTSRSKGVVSGVLEKSIKGRDGKIILRGSYDMSKWDSLGDFFTLIQVANSV
jgi:hypothetical protein